MPEPILVSVSPASLVFAARHPAAAYFAVAFGLSWSSALAVAAPHLLRHHSVPRFAGLMMFPAMLIGPCLGGIALTWIVDGRAGLRDLFSRMLRLRFPMRWFWALLLPPGLMLPVLLCLRVLVSPIYAPNCFVLGVAFGLPAGFFEEIGWMGFAFPKMRSSNGAFMPAIALGLLWSAWHIPVIDHLGTATPHGAYWLPYFLTFAAAMTAMRVLIAWVYSSTESVLLAQLLHASSTGSLVVLSPVGVSPAQEATWCAVYAAALWIVVGIVVQAHGRRLGSDQPARR
jgi:uncharacterized protein